MNLQTLRLVENCSTRPSRCLRRQIRCASCATDSHRMHTDVHAVCVATAIQLAGRDTEESTSIIGARWGHSQGRRSLRHILDQPRVSWKEIHRLSADRREMGTALKWEVSHRPLNKLKDRCETGGGLSPDQSLRLNSAVISISSRNKMPTRNLCC